MSTSQPQVRSVRAKNPIAKLTVNNLEASVLTSHHESITGADARKVAALPVYRPQQSRVQARESCIGTGHYEDAQSVVKSKRAGIANIRACLETTGHGEIKGQTVTLLIKVNLPGIAPRKLMSGFL